MSDPDPQRPQINAQVAADGIEFLRRLTGDIALSGGTATMEEALARLFPRDNDGNIDFEAGRAAAAERLIDSLSELDRNGDISTEERNRINPGEEPARYHGPTIPDANGDPVANPDYHITSADYIRDIFNDDSITSLDQLAERFKNDDTKREMWQLFQLSNSDFAVSFTRDQLELIQYALNEISPGLGDAVVGLIGGFVGADTPSEELGARNELAEGFNAMFAGQVSMAQFHDARVVTTMEDGREVAQPHLVWNGPGGRLDLQAQFFGEGLQDPEGNVMTYQFNTGDDRVYVQNFEDMVLSRWEENGTVTFARDGDGNLTAEGEAARAEFIQYSQQLTMGGELDASFAQTLSQQVGDRPPVLEFATPEAADAFTAFTETLDTRSMNEQEIATAVMEYVQGVQPDVRFVAADPEFDPNARYQPVHDAITYAAGHYVPVGSGQEYSDRIVDFANNHPGVDVSSVLEAEPGGGPRAQDGVRPDPDPDAEPDEVQHGAINYGHFDSNEGGYIDYGTPITVTYDVTTGDVVNEAGDVLFTFSEDGFLAYDTVRSEYGATPNTIDFKAHNEELNFAELDREDMGRLLGGEPFTIRMVGAQDADTDASNTQIYGIHVDSPGITATFGTDGADPSTWTQEFKDLSMPGFEDNGPRADSPSLGQTPNMDDPENPVFDGQVRTADGQQAPVI